MQELLAQRHKTHGDFGANAAASQDFKRTMHRWNWEHLSDLQREALDMIALKISRIITGNANEHDHWRDIAGYATLVESRLAHANAADKVQAAADALVAAVATRPSEIVYVTVQNDPASGDRSFSYTYDGREYPHLTHHEMRAEMQNTQGVEWRMAGTNFLLEPGTL